MDRMKNHSGSSSWLAQALTLGPIGIAAGALLITQLLPVAYDSFTVILIGMGFGLVITGALNIHQAVVFLRHERTRDREVARQILEQLVNEAGSRSLDTLDRLEEVQRREKEEDALLADLASTLDDSNSAEEGRRTA